MDLFRKSIDTDAASLTTLSSYAIRYYSDIYVRIASLFYQMETSRQHPQNRSHFIHTTPTYSSSTSSFPTHCNSVEYTSPISRPSPPFQILFTRYLTSVKRKATGIFLQLFPSSHAIQHYPSLINSPCTNYVFALYSHTPPLFGKIHHSTIIADYKFHSPNVSALLATSPGTPPYRVFIPP